MVVQLKGIQSYD